MAKELVPSSHGQTFVPTPKGSAPVPRKVCQKATLNLNQSYMQLMKVLVSRKCYTNNSIKTKGQEKSIKLDKTEH